MLLIAEDEHRITYLDNVEGWPVRFYKDKESNQLYVNSYDMARVLGCENAHELLSSDDTLDQILQHQKEYPKEPIFMKWWAVLLPICTLTVIKYYKTLINNIITTLGNY